MFLIIQSLFNECASIVRDECPPKEITLSDVITQRLQKAIQFHCEKTKQDNKPSVPEMIIAELKNRRPRDPLFDLVFTEALMDNQQNAENYYGSVFQEELRKIANSKKYQYSSYKLILEYLNMDVFQDVFVRLKRISEKTGSTTALERFDGREPLLGLTATIIERLCKDFLRKKKENQPVLDPKKEEIPVVDPNTNGKDSNVTTMEIRETFEKVQSLFTKEEWVLITFRLRGIKQKDIAALYHEDPAVTNRKYKKIDEKIEKLIQDEHNANEVNFLKLIRSK
ncbi:MAG: hypothetical protein LBC20_12735 [Planctomycetaceae bacterium]|jgi:RNA polymerase sigma factor (sigma-70 family)|nr:hypothetical protein [Planctomycetaceae bacterium]